MPGSPRPSYPPGPPGRRVGSAAALAATGLGALTLSHLLGQYTARGRTFDGAAQEALLDQSERVRLWLIHLLGLVTVPSLTVVLGLLVLAAAAYRRWWTAIAVTVLVGGATVTSQILKYGVLERPDIPAGSDNSLPSGHATIAGAVSLALLLLAPPRWRASATGLAACLAAGGGLTTIWSGSHRPVDVVGAVGVCATWTALAVVLACRDDGVRGGSTGTGRGNAFTWATTGALLPAWVALLRLGFVRPYGALEGGIAVLVIAALVAVTAGLAARALGGEGSSYARSEPPPQRSTAPWRHEDRR